MLFSKTGLQKLTIIAQQAGNKPLELRNSLTSRKSAPLELENMPTLTNNNILIVFANSALNIKTR